MKLGVIIRLNNEIDIYLKKTGIIGINTCQLCCWNESFFTDDTAEYINRAMSEHKIEITALWCGWEGPRVWDFYAGPATLGLVPPAYRFSRIKTLCKGSDFAKKLGVKDIVTHAGFIPENPNDSNYIEVLEAVKYVASYCRSNGQSFLFETGQETPVTLKRLIEDTGLDNIGVNLDPANLLMYGKANPVDAVDILGKYIKGVHVKDGEYPTNGRELGEEKALGKGRVNFTALIQKLKEIGYDGALTIEREISGEEQKKDILTAKRLLEEIISSL